MDEVLVAQVVEATLLEDLGTSLEPHGLSKWHTCGQSKGGQTGPGGVECQSPGRGGGSDCGGEGRGGAEQWLGGWGGGGVGGVTSDHRLEDKISASQQAAM